MKADKDWSGEVGDALVAHSGGSAPDREVGKGSQGTVFKMGSEEREIKCK